MRPRCHGVNETWTGLFVGLLVGLMDMKMVVGGSSERGKAC